MQTYQALVEVVEKASKDNLAQAQLISKIKSLGTSAIKLAKKIPWLGCIVLILNRYKKIRYLRTILTGINPPVLFGLKYNFKVMVKKLQVKPLPVPLQKY